MSTALKQVLDDDRAPFSVKSVQDADSAYHATNLISLTDHWPKIWKWKNTRRLTALSNKAHRLIKKFSKNLPNRFDEWGNEVETLSIPDMSEAEELASKLGCVHFNNYDVSFAGLGDCISVTYMEGDFSIIKGKLVHCAYDEFVTSQEDWN